MYGLRTEIKPVIETAPYNLVRLMVRKNTVFPPFEYLHAAKPSSMMKAWSGGVFFFFLFCLPTVLAYFLTYLGNVRLN